ncbi:MAG: hypothetical protein WAL67_11770, partial [Candidatus Cybelea sp.]
MSAVTQQSGYFATARVTVATAADIKRRGRRPPPHALLERGSLEQCGEEASVVAVTGADGVRRYNVERVDVHFLVLIPAETPIFSALYDDRV